MALKLKEPDEEVHGPNHPNTSAVLNNLTSVLPDFGRYEEALPLLERSLQIEEEVNGPNYPRTAAG